MNLIRAFSSLILSILMLILSAFFLLQLLPEQFIDSSFFLTGTERHQAIEFNFFSKLYAQPVFDLIPPFFLNSFFLIFTSFITAIIIALFLNFFSYGREASILRFIIHSILAMPLLAFCFFAIYFFTIEFHLFPPHIIWDPLNPYGIPFFKSLLLPFLILTVSQSAIFFKYLEAFISQEKNKPYIQTAISKGCSRTMRFYRHLLVNIRLPYIHVLFTRFIQLFSGSMIIELIFNYPGVGLLTYEAVRFGDYPLALTLITSIGIFIALIHFVLELISPFLDPRLA